MSNHSKSHPGWEKGSWRSPTPASLRSSWWLLGEGECQLNSEIVSLQPPQGAHVPSRWPYIHAQIGSLKGLSALKKNIQTNNKTKNSSRSWEGHMVIREWGLIWSKHQVHVWNSHRKSKEGGREKLMVCRFQALQRPPTSKLRNDFWK